MSQTIEYPSIVAQAPGRVELLGNHTDHNNGLVLAAAIDRYTIVFGFAEPGRVGRVVSKEEAKGESFVIDGLTAGEQRHWGQYVQGVTSALGDWAGPLTSGFTAAVTGDLPRKKGLSSSASLEAAFAMFLLAARVVPGRSEDLDDEARIDLAKTLRGSENEFAKVESGLLDQFSILFGLADHALTLDCRSSEWGRLSLGNPAPAIVVVDSMTSRRLDDGEIVVEGKSSWTPIAQGNYKERRAECQSVADYFRERKKAAEKGFSLREVTHDDLAADWDRLDPTARLRARHVLTENDRVLDGGRALRAGDIPEFGRLMSASHASSRDDFGNSSNFLNALIEAAESSPGFLGGKLSGAGWAGCTVNLVATGQTDAFSASVADVYTRRTGLTPIVHICHAADGAWGRIADDRGTL